MKKFLTLTLLSLLVGVSANAADVTRRIVAELQDNGAGSGLVSTWEGWKDGPHIHVYYNNGNADVLLTGDWWTTSMTYQGSYTNADKARKVYYTDVTADESVFANYDLNIIIAGKGTDDQYNEYNRITWSGKYDNDKIFYLYIVDGIVKNTAVDINYYLVDSQGKNLSTLTYNNGVAIGEYTNSVTTYAVLAPNYALWDDFNGIRDWSLVYRPNNKGSDFAINAFQVYSDGLEGTEKTFCFSQEMSYALNFNVIGKSFTVTPYISKTIANNDMKLGTFSADGKTAIPDDVTAYIGKLNGETVTLEEITGAIPANTGILYKGANAGATVKFYATNDDEATFTGNILAATGSAGKTLSEGDYVLATINSQNLGFYPVNAAAAYDPFKAYIPKASVGDGLAKLAINFGDETGVANLSHEKTDNVYYDLQGRRVMNPTKGLFIVNGKKVIK